MKVMTASPNDTFPGVAKLHTIFGASDVPGMALDAIDAYEQDARQPVRHQQRQPWAVGVQHSPYGQKLIFKVQLSTTTNRTQKKSISFPTRTDPAIASKQIQKIFQRHLMHCAIAEDELSAEFVARHEGVMYDYTINFMTGHSIAHSDEPEGDGPDAFISNLCLQGEGMLYFFDKKPRS